MHLSCNVTHCQGWLIANCPLQVATQAIAHMPSLLLFPLVPFLLEVALVFWWVYVAAYLYSSGMLQSCIVTPCISTRVTELTTRCCVKSAMHFPATGHAPSACSAWYHSFIQHCCASTYVIPSCSSCHDDHDYHKMAKWFDCQLISVLHLK